VIPTVLTQALAKTREIRLGNLEPRRDLTYVEDTVRAFVLAMDAPGIEGMVIHVGQGKAVSVGELARQCLQVVEASAEIVSMPDRQRPGKSEVELLICNPGRARQLLGWEPTVSLTDGLRRTANYLELHASQYDTRRYVI
jgi:nucleoside-diphosphate-sugar epimerase